jgi:2-furoate---CoA ligase
MTLRINNFTIPSLLRQAVDRTPEKDAIIDINSGKHYTYHELEAVVRSIANGLSERGIGHGDRVAICLKNRVEHCITFLACQELGAVPVPFNFRLKIDTIRYTLEDCDPAIFVFGDTVSEDVSTLSGSVPVDKYVHVGDNPLSFAEPFEALRSDADSAPSNAVRPDDLSVIQYSSGTTGDPKGVKIDHLSSSTRVMVNVHGQRFQIDTEKMLGVMPLYHTVGLHGIFCSMLAVSGTYICQPDFESVACVERIEEFGITAMHEAPTIYKKLVETDEIKDHSMASVRVLTYSGAPMDSTLLERVKAEFDPEFLSNQYGCTEAYGPLGQPNLLEEGSTFETGPTNLLQTTRIVELDSNDPEAQVEQGVEGELIVSMKSPTVFSGYLNKPEITEASIHDGWFFTGDVAYRTTDRRTVITGRADDMIISGGENIYPVEIEEELASNPDVVDVGVVGIEDETWGEVPKAFVVCRGEIESAELDQQCMQSSTLADFKRPREYEFLEALPRNESGKIQKYKLREQDY